VSDDEAANPNLPETFVKAVMRRGLSTDETGRVQAAPYEIRRLLDRLGITYRGPWVWLTTDGVISPSHMRLRVDDGGPPREIPLPNRSFQRWNGYSFDLIGIPLDRTPMKLGSEQYWGANLHLDVRYMRLCYQESVLYVEYIASEREQANFAVWGYIQDHSTDDRVRAQEGLRLLRDFEEDRTRSSSRLPKAYIEKRGRRVALYCKERDITDPTTLTAGDLVEALGLSNEHSMRNTLSQRGATTQHIKAEAYRLIYDKLV
jgi:hypothetical protein